jgi:hypothetical protein
LKGLTPRWRIGSASYLAISGGWHLVRHRGLVIDAPRARISINGGVISTNNAVLFGEDVGTRGSLAVEEI